MTGRFAPSPTGPLHVGNLRTALLAWLLARSSGDAGFLVRMEDLDRANSSPEQGGPAARRPRRLGLDWDGPSCARASASIATTRPSTASLGAGLTYECFCSRREIREAIAAPHVDDGRLPRHVPRPLAAPSGRPRRATRPPAVRLRSTGEVVTVDDALAGPFTGVADDVVLRRNDGVPAYNLAVVVDDAAQGVDRGRAR